MSIVLDTGDASAAFEQEVRPHADRLFRLAIWFERSSADAEDLDSVGTRRNTTIASIALLSLLLVLAPSSEAQSITPSRVRSAIGLGLGLSDDGNRSGDGRHALVSGSYELPLGDVVRIRVDAARTHQPIPSPVAGGPPNRAHISRLTISLATVKSPFAPITPYGGAGIGFYRASFEHGPTTLWRRGAYLHGGIEVHANDAIAIDGEFGLHIIPQTLYPEAPCWARSWRE